jgi:tRNA pseudouridine38-40 synthase
LRNVRLIVAYDGTDFHGFATSGGQRTVMGELSAAVSRVVRTPVELAGAGRTDAGVHGWGQVVSGLLPASTDLERLARSVNGLCSPSIAVRSIEWADDDFSARFSATARSYRYDVWNHVEPNPLIARVAWHVVAPLDVDAMNDGAQALIGDHDFSSFCRRPKPRAGHDEPSMVRRLVHAEWSVVDDTFGTITRFEVTATSFCHQMVRSIVGTLVEVGTGKRTAQSVEATLAALGRSAAGVVAPPHGLVLWEVDYRGTRWNV